MQRAAMVVAMLGLSACIGNEVVERDQVVIGGPYERVEIRIDAGDVVLAQGSGPNVVVDRVQRYRADPPKLVAQVIDGVLTIDADCHHCSVHHDILLPSGAPVTITTGAGDVVIDSLSGTLEIDTGAGDLRTLGVHGAALLQTGAGDIDLVDHYGDVHAVTDSGDLELELRQAAFATAHSQAGNVVVTLDERPIEADLKSQAGDVHLELPSGAYAVNANTQAGDVVLDGITPDTSADAKLTATSQAGDVTLIGR